MTYAVAFTAKADHETIGLPTEAFVALIERLGAICREPWATTHVDDPVEPAFRWATFGQSGIVGVYIDDAHRVVRIHDVTWAG